jgi:hypothetical protein
MNIQWLARLVSLAALVGTILPSILVFNGTMDLDTAKTAMIIATVVWFVATPLWMGRAKGHAASSSADRDSH